MELQTAKEIVQKGLLKAAESLSFFMNEDIKLAEMECCFDPPCDLINHPEKESSTILLTTKIIGELKGICCLIFNEDEANHLRAAALPPEITANPEIMEEMKDGILLEVDNIISASVITQFSNILKIKIHGGVPALKRLSGPDLNQSIKNQLVNDLYIINFNTHFVSSRLDFSPRFLWFFDESFANSIKNYAADKNKL